MDDDPQHAREAGVRGLRQGSVGVEEIGHGDAVEQRLRAGRPVMQDGVQVLVSQVLGLSNDRVVLGVSTVQ